MNAHETALLRALSGGPAPVEDRLHLTECQACRDELEALRSVETALRDAKPGYPLYAAPPLAIPGDSRRTSRLAASFAAVGLFCGALGGAVLWGGRAPALSARPPLPPEMSLFSGSEESTFTLLEKAGEEVSGANDAEALSNYLATHWGG